MRERNTERPKLTKNCKCLRFERMKRDKFYEIFTTPAPSQCFKMLLHEFKKHSLTLLELEKRRYLQNWLSDKGFKGTIVNRALPSLHGDLLESMLNFTVPLRVVNYKF